MSRADLGPEGASPGGRAVHTPLFDLVSEDGCPMMGAPDTLPNDTLYYWDYLHLDYLLNAQTPKSAQADEVIHDEYFFIVVHQTYELWFKQILVELDSVMTIMGQERIPRRTSGPSWPGCAASTRSSACSSPRWTCSRR